MKAEFKTRKSRRTYEGIFKASIDLFAKKGFRQTTMREIAEKTGLGLGGIYYYCRSKEELVVHFYEHISRQAIFEFEALGLSADIGDLFARFVNLKIEKLSPYRDLLRVVFKEAIDPSSPLSPFNNASAQTLNLSVTFFANLLKQSAAFNGRDVVAAARGLWLLHMALLAFWVHDNSGGYEATHRATKSVAALVHLFITLGNLPWVAQLEAPLNDLSAVLFERSSDSQERTGKDGVI